MKGLSIFLLFASVWMTLSQSGKAQISPQEQPQKDRSIATSTEKTAQEVSEGDVVRVTTSLVKVPVAVRDRAGLYISDLEKEDFHVYESDGEKRIANFGGVEEPISIVLLIDVSCSIKKPQDTITAALAFVDSLRPADSLLPIAFGKQIYALLTESTRDHVLLRARILELPDGTKVPCDRGGTRLGDAVEFVIHHVLKNGKGRGAVLLLTDGRDSNMSKPGWMYRTLRDVSELGVPFYSIRLWGDDHWPFTGFPGDPPAGRAKLWFSAKDYIGYIDQLARLSGGRSYPSATGETLKKYFYEIGEELRHQYVLAYYAQPSKDKRERRKIKVRVDRPNVSIRARESYIYFPGQK